jgi:hypothetical protein
MFQGRADSSSARPPPERLMKKNVLILITILCLFLAVPVQAQTPESIWITPSTTSFKTGEMLIVTVHAASGTAVQGFTFQIAYDPACLQPTNAASPISGMNGLMLPQGEGLVDATFASTTPHEIDGVLAEVHFLTLGACETNVTLENAALAIRNEAGFAAPLPGVTVEEKTIPLSISGERGSSQDLPLLGTPLPLGLEPADSAPPLSSDLIIVLIVIGVFLLIGIFVLIRILKRNDNG